jgi:hypothetical protein
MKTLQITPSTRRRANGWQATLEFPNSGIQAFSSLYSSMEEAARAANGLLTARLANPEGCVPDPAPNMLQEI